MRSKQKSVNRHGAKTRALSHAKGKDSKGVPCYSQAGDLAVPATLVRQVLSQSAVKDGGKRLHANQPGLNLADRDVAARREAGTDLARLSKRETAG